MCVCVECICNQFKIECTPLLRLDQAREVRVCVCVWRGVPPPHTLFAHHTVSAIGRPRPVRALETVFCVRGRVFIGVCDAVRVCVCAH